MPVASSARGALALVLASAAAAGLVACERRGASDTRLGSDAPIAVAIDRIVDYLTPRRLEYDELWFVHQGAAQLGPPFPTWARALRPNGSPSGAEQALRSTRDLDLRAPPRLGPVPEVQPRPVPPFAQSYRETVKIVARLLTLAATCAPGDPEPSEALRALTGTRTQGYLLGHQAWALEIGAARGCLVGDWVDRRRRAMARELLAELLGDGDAPNDLDIERAAVLCLIGACHWVPEAWFEALLARQQASGSWGDVTPPGVEPGTVREEHAVALAFYALARRWQLAGARGGPGRGP